MTFCNIKYEESLFPFSVTAKFFLEKEMKKKKQKQQQKLFTRVSI